MSRVSAVDCVDQVKPEEAWELVLNCWMAFFNDLRDVRVACAGLSLGQTDIDSTKRKEVVARYVWTMGKAIAVQNQYIEHEFKNHPTIARVINYHIFHHKVPMAAYKSAVDSFEQKFRDLFTWKGQITRSVTKLENKK